MCKECLCEKCKKSFVVTEPTENEKVCAMCLQSEELNDKTEECKRSKKDLFIESALKEKGIRNIAILVCRTISNKSSGNKYIELVGLDIFEGKVVNLVDENGKNKGLHTYKREIANFKFGDVISVPVKFVDNCICANMLRICGSGEEIKIIGETDFIKLRAKYKNIYQHDICWTFEELITMERYKKFYCLAYFKETQIKKHREKLQISFVTTNGKPRYYVDCLDKTKGIKDGKWMRGMCLLKAVKNGNTSNEYRYYMIKNMAKIASDKKMLESEEIPETLFLESNDEDVDLPF